MLSAISIFFTGAAGGAGVDMVIAFGWSRFSGVSRLLFALFLEALGLGVVFLAAVAALGTSCSCGEHGVGEPAAFSFAAATDEVATSLVALPWPALSLKEDLISSFGCGGGGVLGFCCSRANQADDGFPRHERARLSLGSRHSSLCYSKVAVRKPLHEEVLFLFVVNGFSHAGKTIAEIVDESDVHFNVFVVFKRTTVQLVAQVGPVCNSGPVELIANAPNQQLHLPAFDAGCIPDHFAVKRLRDQRPGFAPANVADDIVTDSGGGIRINACFVESLRAFAEHDVL